MSLDKEKILCPKCGSESTEDESHAVLGSTNDHHEDGTIERPEMRVFVCDACKFEFDESMTGRRGE